MMTPKELDNLSLDELRVEVAKALGHRVALVGQDNFPFIVDADDWIQMDQGDHGAVPDYPRDIAAAWKLLDALLERNFYWRMHPDTSHVPAWIIVIVGERHQGWGATTPEAICRAFLKAVYCG